MELIFIIFLTIFSLTCLGLFMYQFNKNRMDKAQNYEELDRVKE
jgi:hypothetical protein